jgi:hypothetical protein
VDFKQYLLIVERSLVDPAIFQSYENEFQRQLDALIQRSQEPLRQTLAAMKACPVKDSRGRCSSFTNYIVGCLLRHGCAQRYDPEDSLQYIAMHMLSPTGERGQPRRTLFDLDPNYSWDLQRGNPLEARFKLHLRHDLAAICGGIISTIEQYARETENRRLLRLLDRFKNFDATQPEPTDRYQPTKPKPQQPPPDEKDYRSIVDVLERHGQQANLAILGKVRRRWLEYPPRDPNSPHPNRLADVLAKMVSDGVLQEKKTRAGGRLYVPGRRYQEFLSGVTVGV